MFLTVVKKLKITLLAELVESRPILPVLSRVYYILMRIETNKNKKAAINQRQVSIVTKIVSLMTSVQLIYTLNVLLRKAIFIRWID